VAIPASARRLRLVRIRRQGVSNQHHGVGLGGPFLRGHLVPPFAGLSPSALQVLAAVVSFDFAQGRGEDVRKGYSYPSNARLASETGLSESTVKRALHALEAKGYILRTRLRRGRARRDFRFLFINYARLERGHRLMLALRAGAPQGEARELEQECAEGFQEDDRAFLERLLRDGHVNPEQLARKVRDPSLAGLRRVISDPSIHLEGSPVTLAIGWVNQGQTPCPIGVRATQTAREEDEVQIVSRSSSVRRVDLQSTVSPTDPQAIAPPRQKRQATDGRKRGAAAKAARRALSAAGFDGAPLERAMAVLFHFLEVSGTWEPLEVEDVIEAALEPFEGHEREFDQLFLNEFAHCVSVVTECVGG